MVSKFPTNVSLRGTYDEEGWGSCGNPLQLSIVMIPGLNYILDYTQTTQITLSSAALAGAKLGLSEALLSSSIATSS